MKTKNKKYLELIIVCGSNSYNWNTWNSIENLYGLAGEITGPGLLQ